MEKKIWSIMAQKYVNKCYECSWQKNFPYTHNWNTGFRLLFKLWQLWYCIYIFTYNLYALILLWTVSFKIPHYFISFYYQYSQCDYLYMIQKRILDYTKYEMLNKAVQAFSDLGEDEELGPTDWPTVKRYITSLNNLEEQQVHPHSPSESDGRLDPTNLKDIRIRFLNGMYFIVFAFSPATLFLFQRICVLVLLK